MLKKLALAAALLTSTIASASLGPLEPLFRWLMNNWDGFTF